MIREYGSEFPHFSSPENLYFRKLFSLTDNVLLLRSGREALGAVAQFHKTSRSVVLVPAYACSSMITPFTYRDWSIIYYPVDEDFVPDTDYILQTIKREKVSAILLMNYWDVVCLTNVLSMIKQYDENVITIVDQTHSVFSIKNMDVHADYYVGSIRKWMGISDGAFLLAKKEIRINGVMGNSFFSSIRSFALDEKAEYSFSLNPALKSDFREKLGAAEDNLNKCTEIYQMSLNNIFHLYNLDCSFIIESRKKNYDVLIKKLTNAGIKIAYSQQLFGVDVPFSIPILVESRDEVQRRLAQNGVYAAVLWPISKDAENICPLAKKMADKMLSIPIDQRYNVFDMEDMARIIIENIR